ncbi:MAG: DNRLRE domain-containing protein [Chloroflexi bacterium]|nr:DNRLRE domain-containing protein [Chloroflexota bacterium]
MGAIVGSAWLDANDNGLRDGGELPFPGLPLRLEQGGQVMLTSSTDADGGYRFVLPPGLYNLVATAPAGYQLTTPAVFSLFVGSGVTLNLDFGVYLIPSPTPTPTRQPLLNVEGAPRLVCGGTVRGNTQAGQANVSRYGCRPAWSEDGPELIYRVDISQAQPLSAAFLTVTADLDLFLLPSAQPESCLAAGDSYLAQDVQPGVYYLVVDGYNGAAGEFEMRLTCPLETQATPTPTTIPSPTPTATATFTPGPTSTPTRTPQPRFRYLPFVLRAYPSPTPQPVTLVLQQDTDGYTGATDTTLNAWLPTTAQGSASILRLRYNADTQQTTHMAPLLRFDLALLPTETHVVQAVLRLYLVEMERPQDIRGETHGLLRSWSEATATWLGPAAGQTWAEPGANGIGTDHVSWATDHQLIATPAQWYTFDVVQLVQTWVADPASNRGVVVLAQPGDSGSNIEARFASREYADRTLRPQLAVSYWVPAAAAESRSR